MIMKEMILKINDEKGNVLANMLFFYDIVIDGPF